MSKELIERLYDEAQDNTESLEWKAADALEAQQSWIDSLEQNAKDADRLYAELKTELAAAQAQIRVLRESLDDFAHNWDCDDDAHKYGTPCRACAAEEALAQPTDDSALRELLKAERERCAKVCEKKYPHYDGSEHPCFEDAEECAAAIRAMGSE